MTRFEISITEMFLMKTIDELNKPPTSVIPKALFWSASTFLTEKNRKLLGKITRNSKRFLLVIRTFPVKNDMPLKDVQSASGCQQGSAWYGTSTVQGITCSES